MCSVLSDCDIKKEPKHSDVSDCEISIKRKFEDIDTDIRKKDDHIKLRINFDETIDIKYEDFEYDGHSHILGEDHTIHPNNDSPHTSTQSMVENISMELGNIKNLDANLEAVEKRTKSLRKKRITCNICHKSFSKVFNFELPYKTVFIKKEKPFSCVICHSSFSIEA